MGGNLAHKANLCNFGILPLIFKNNDDYQLFEQGKKVTSPEIRHHIEEGEEEIPVQVDGKEVLILLQVSERQRQHLVAGGSLNFA